MRKSTIQLTALAILSLPAQAQTVQSTAIFYEYDELGQMIAVRGNDGQNVRYKYDLNGNVVSIFDSLNRETKIEYDGLYRTSKSTDSSGRITTFEYDAGDQLTKFTDGRGNATSYVYDGFGALWSRVSPDTGITTFTYTAGGLLSTMSRADGVLTSYDYDGLGRLTSVTAGAEVHGFIRDNCTGGKGLLCSATDSTGSVSYTYTPEGNVATQVSLMPTGGSASISYSYDGMGRLTGTTYPNVVVSYSYLSGRINAITANVAGITRTVISDVTYRPFGPTTGWTYGNGLSRVHSYDLDGRVVGLSVRNASAVMQSLTYSHNQNNEIDKITNAAVSALTQTYAYDDLSRLVSVTATNANQNMSYDSTGNRISHLSGGATDTYINPSGSNRLSEIVGPHGTTIAYTDNGNVASMAGMTYTYDAFNHLKGAISGSNTTTYFVNALGQRVYKQGALGEYWFAYTTSGEMIAEFKTGQGWTTYLKLEGEPIALVRGDQLYFVHDDHLGRPEIVTDGSSNIVWRASNFAFDRTVTLDGIGGLNLGFPGQYYDAETGNWHNGFRDYDSSIGRYLQSDPIGLAGGVNTYTYAGGNPVNRVDPYGLKDHSTCETKGILDLIKKQMTGDTATRDALRNHTGAGDMDFRAREESSTFNYGGRTMTAAQFGNYAAGYAGWYYGGASGLSLVMWGGVYYDFSDDIRGRDTPNWQNNHFDFDVDSRQDILDGAKRAMNEIESGLSTCGCGK